MTENTSDSGMVRMMFVVVAAICAITLVCAAMARMIGISDGDGGDPLMRTALVERIKPVGAVRTVLEAPTAAVAAVAAVEMTMEERFVGACAACHGDPGIPTAPKIGSEEWAAREGGDIDALTASAIAGKGAMPARGASTYSDEEIRELVEYLVGN